MKRDRAGFERRGAVHLGRLGVCFAVMVGASMPAQAFTRPLICAALLQQTLPDPAQFELLKRNDALMQDTASAEVELRFAGAKPDKTAVTVGRCTFADGDLPVHIESGGRSYSQAEIVELNRRMHAGQ